MAAYTDSLGFTKGEPAFTSSYTDRLSVFDFELDFAAIAAARDAGGAAALATADTLELFDVPKGALVLGMTATVITAEGAAGNIDVGVKGGTTDYWLDGFDLNAAAGTTAGVADTASGAYYATADTTVLMTVNSDDVDAAKIKIHVAMVNMGTDQGSIPNVG
jgi:hypothetical protein